MTHQELARMRALVDATTPGDWFTDSLGRVLLKVSGVAVNIDRIIAVMHTPDRTITKPEHRAVQRQANGEFVASAHQDMRALLDYVELLQHLLCDKCELDDPALGEIRRLGQVDEYQRLKAALRTTLEKTEWMVLSGRCPCCGGFLPAMYPARAEKGHIDGCLLAELLS